MPARLIFHAMKIGRSARAGMQSGCSGKWPLECKSVHIVYLHKELDEARNQDVKLQVRLACIPWYVEDEMTPEYNPFDLGTNVKRNKSKHSDSVIDIVCK